MFSRWTRISVRLFYPTLSDVCVPAGLAKGNATDRRMLRHHVRDARGSNYAVKVCELKVRLIYYKRLFAGKWVRSISVPCFPTLHSF